MSGATKVERMAVLRALKPYPSYKESGIEWLGRVPAHWGLKRLRSTVISCQNGVWGDEPDGLNDVLCVRVADFDRLALRVWSIVDPTLRSVDASVVANRGLHSGDLLLEKSGGGENQPVGTVVLYEGQTSAVCSNFIARMPVANGFSPRFLTYLHAELYAVRINTRSIKQNTGIQNLDSASYLTEPAAFPEVEEQSVIAAFLDRETAKIDALVAKKERLIELLHEQRTSLITNAVTKGLDPSVAMKESGVEWLGEIPAHWAAIRMGRLADVGNGSTPSRDNAAYWVDGAYPWLTSAKINDEIITSADEFVTATALRECHLPKVCPGSVLIAITGEGQTRGRTALLEIESAISQHLVYITPRGSRLQAGYLRRYLESRYLWLRSESSGAGSTRAALTCEFLRWILIAVPPANEQRAIAAFLDQATARIDALEAKIRQAIDQIRQLRTALISAAVTGKIDVREDA